MEELNFIGNCLKGSRPVLSFDAAFDKQAHLRVIKELFTQIFGVPKTSRKVKPFVDHVMGFTVADGKIWIRVFQINESETSKKKPADGEEMDVDEAPKKKKGSEFDVNLVEIGPRFVLTPIVIQESSFGGPIIYENKEFVSPNQIRSDLRKSKAGRFNKNRRAEGYPAQASGPGVDIARWSQKREGPAQRQCAVRVKMFAMFRWKEKWRLWNASSYLDWRRFWAG